MRRDADTRLTLQACVAKWSGEAETLRRLGAHVVGATLIEAILTDLRHVKDGEASEPLTLKQAARESGLSAEHLGRLVREGTIPNAGRWHAPRILRRDLPRKPGALREPPPTPQLVGATPGQIARAVVTSSGDPR
jgi:hypothetical protein